MNAAPVVAVTGANGYIGSLIVSALSRHAKVIPLVRSPRKDGEHAWRFQMTTEEMTQVLQRNAVTHLIHVAWEMKVNSLDEVERSCVDGTKRLLAATAAAGTKHIVFISTISAFAGARSVYGKSKWAVERMVLANGGLVFRLGLVGGDGDGGVFGSLATVARRRWLIPLIHGGSGNQFLLHERCLCEAVLRAMRGEFLSERRVITLAHPEPIRMSDLLRRLAAASGRKVLLIPIPWRLLYIPLRAAELLNIPMGFRSDSLISFVYHNPEPDFAPMLDHRIDMLPFSSWH